MRDSTAAARWAAPPSSSQAASNSSAGLDASVIAHRRASDVATLTPGPAAGNTKSRSVMANVSSTLPWPPALSSRKCSIVWFNRGVTCTVPRAAAGAGAGGEALQPCHAAVCCGQQL